MEMSEEEVQQMRNSVKTAQLVADQEKLRNTQQEIMKQEDLKGIISEQLDLDNEIEKIGYLLKGYTLEKNEETQEYEWRKPEDNNTKILSDYGVRLIKNVIQFYLNKNTLLSNYDEATINRKMEDFSNSLNDDIFMEYDKVFLYPSLEDCKRLLDDRIKRKEDVRVYAQELLGKELSAKEKQEITDKILEELQPIIEKELEKIREQLMKNKLKRFELLIRCVQDAVHSTYNRAWKGQERTTLRQHTHISENRGSGAVVQQPHSSSFNPFNWRKK